MKILLIYWNVFLKIRCFKGNFVFRIRYIFQGCLYLDDRIRQIRASEKKSHIEMYSNEELYKSESWLKKPIKTVQELIPMFKEYKRIHILDLGCGIGRNSIPIACEYKNIECIVDCVDILELAIEKLYANADTYGVSSAIHGVIKAIEDFAIKKNYYDFIMAVSSLEHVESEKDVVNKLVEIKNGIRENGIVCLVVNSNVKEFDKVTGSEIPAQFEVNLPTEEMQMILNKMFEGWTVLKTSVSEQQYDIPREHGISELKTSVVTFVARNEGME